jgi:Fic family protein
MDTKEQNIKKAIFIAKKNLAGLVYDFQTIEGMPFTLPEVQTYLQGITVGGHKVSDEQKLNQQALAWKRLIELVEKNEFELNKKNACELERIVAKDEALFSGVFRDGMVTVSGRERPLPEPHMLDGLFNKLCKRVAQTNDVLKKGFIVSLDIANQQYFWDGNKRTGILLMNGILISNGYMPLSIPAKDILEYNTKMHRFHNTGKEDEMIEFMSEIYKREYPYKG